MVELEHAVKKLFDLNPVLEHVDIKTCYEDEKFEIHVVDGIGSSTSLAG